MKNPDAGQGPNIYISAPVAFADSLRAWRNRTGLSQSQTASLIGISVATYQGWEHGRPSPYAKAVLMALYSITPMEEEAANGDAS
jgi:transcriptional regulator with XRE-family HTH domain